MKDLGQTLSIHGKPCPQCGTRMRPVRYSTYYMCQHCFMIKLVPAWELYKDYRYGQFNSRRKR